MDIQWTEIQPSNHISIGRDQHRYQKSLLIREVSVDDARSYIYNVIISPTVSSVEFIETLFTPAPMS